MVDSSIKISFEDLANGRVTDINPNSGNSFSTACNGGATNGDWLLLVMATVYYTNSIMESSNKSLQMSTFCRGNTWFRSSRDRIWFDANDGSGRQMWSSDGNIMEGNQPFF